MSMISHMSHIWNYCDLCENFYVADTIRRQVKPIHKDWNICDLCEKFYVADVSETHSQRSPPNCSWRHLDFSQIKCEFCDNTIIQKDVN